MTTGLPATDLDEVPSADVSPTQPTGASSRRRGAWLEALLLVISPVLGLIATGGQRMIAVSMIDPTFYTAFAQHGPELLTRYGQDNYYWARQGFLLPARLAFLAFGGVPGFLVLRYAFALIAVVPTYLLLRRTFGRLAGATGVAIILVNPVVLTAWGTDYPDSSAVAYLFAGIACLCMPVAGRSSRQIRVRRASWVVVAAVALTLAVHSQTWSIPLVAASVLGYVIAYGGWSPLSTGEPEQPAANRRLRRWRWAEAIAHAVLMAVVFVWTTGGLVLGARLVFGSGNIIAPTIHAAEFFRTPAQLAKWHSSGWRWIIDDPYLFVLPAVVIGWVLLAAPTLPRLGRWMGWRRSDKPPNWSECAVVLTMALQGMAVLAGQFLGKAAVVEFFLYSSMLWAGGCLTTAFLVARLTRSPTPRPLAVRLIPLALVLATPWALVPFTPGLEFDMVPAGSVLVVAIVLAVALALWRPWTALTAIVTAAVLVGAQTLIVGIPVHKPLRAGQVLLPAPPYGYVVGWDNQGVVDRYRVISEIPSIVPPPDGVGNDDLMMWWPPGGGDTVNLAAAEYLWHRNSIAQDMPALDTQSKALLNKRQPELLLLLSLTGAEFAPAVAALTSAGFTVGVDRVATFHSGDTTVHAEVLSMGGYGG